MWHDPVSMTIEGYAPYTRVKEDPRYGMVLAAQSNNGIVKLIDTASCVLVTSGSRISVVATLGRQCWRSSLLGAYQNQEQDERNLGVVEITSTSARL
jgi:hypothetical protein